MMTGMLCRGPVMGLMNMGNGTYLFLAVCGVRHSTALRSVGAHPRALVPFEFTQNVLPRVLRLPLGFTI